MLVVRFYFFGPLKGFCGLFSFSERSKGIVFGYTPFFPLHVFKLKAILVDYSVFCFVFLSLFVLIVPKDIFSIWFLTLF